MTAPDFDELVGDVGSDERERLRRVHELLVAAGPPPDVPAALARPPAVSYGRRRFIALGLAAALAVAAFAGGWFARGGDDFTVRRVVAMQGTEHAPDARATLSLGHPDANGNWEMKVEAQGLEPLPDDGYYELLLTIRGKPVATCGSFKVGADGSARVRLGASYTLKEFDGWVVRPYVHDRDELNETVVLRTPRV